MQAKKERLETLLRREVLVVEFFPGQALPTLTDYVRLVKTVKVEGIQSALLEYNLVIEAYLAINTRWFNRLTRDETLAKIFREEMLNEN